MSHFNPFMNESSLPVHEQLIKSLKNPSIVWDRYLMMNVTWKSWISTFNPFMNGSCMAHQLKKPNHSLWYYLDEWCFYPCSWTSTFNPFMNVSFLPVPEWCIIVLDQTLKIMHKLPWIRGSWTGKGTCSWTHVKCTFMNTCKMHVQEHIWNECS